jgi:teichuronic acid biosynthesis glycosyltransferase TuaC
MRIAFLCKRRYMGKDVITDRYARLYEIPNQLARLGHEVRGFCFSYQRDTEQGSWTHDVPGPGSLAWESHGAGQLVLPALLRYPSRMLCRLRALAPDLVIGASDIPHVALGSWLAAQLHRPFVVDLYDNFEGFGQARIPGMVAALRHAVRGAALVTTTSEPLKDMVQRAYRAQGQVLAMPSTVDKELFRPVGSIACRRALGLPEHARLIGTAGGLMRNRGIDTVYGAWQRIASQREDVHLVLAGPVDPALPVPSGPRVHYLGLLPHAQTALLFNAIDVGIIYLRDTPFGHYCFPQKAYEMLACKLPVVAARVGAMADLFADSPENLYQPDDVSSLVDAVLAQLDTPSRPIMEVRDWEQLIGSVEPLFRALAR